MKLPRYYRQLIGYGNPETGARRTTTIRSFVDVPIDGHPTNLMALLGYVYEAEFWK
jgi:hypothetical protein